MKRLSTKFLPAILVMFLMSFSVLAQTKVGGQVSDAASKEALIGVSIAVKAKLLEQ